MEYLKIKVKTGCREDEVVKEEGHYSIKLKSKPIEGEANKELIKLLSRHFKKQARIVKGFKSKEKLIEFL